MGPAKCRLAGFLAKRLDRAFLGWSRRRQPRGGRLSRNRLQSDQNSVGIVRRREITWSVDAITGLQANDQIFILKLVDPPEDPVVSRDQVDLARAVGGVDAIRRG